MNWLLIIGVLIGVIAALLMSFGLVYLTSKAEQEEDERLRYEQAQRNRGTK